MNGLGEDKVILYENIVSTRDVTMYINIFPMGPSATAYVSDEPGESNDDTVAVPAVRADKVALPSAAGPVGIVKIDVEGCEINALLSASEHFAVGKAVTGAPDLFIELCPYLFTRCNTSPEDEAAAWGLLEQHDYTVLLQHHDAGEGMPELPPGSVRLDGRDLPEEFEAEYAKMPGGSYSRARTLYWVPPKWKDFEPYVTAHKPDADGNGAVQACFQMWLTTLYELDPDTAKSGKPQLRRKQVGSSAAAGAKKDKPRKRRSIDGL
eukprot:SAG22_NODE_889_length_6648_cov_6.695984_5_plen_265_part_00